MLKRDLDCSIIIPTYNRPNLLRRILLYYNELNMPYNIIIGDSSTEENKKVNKSLISSLSSLTINYMDEFPPSINPLKKILVLIKNINTKFGVICADDDFIIPNAINKACNYLKKHPDYSAAAGRFISFWVQKSNNKDYFYWRMINHRLYKSNKINNIKSRLLLHSADYAPTFYYVHRTKLLKIVIKEALQIEFDYKFTELLPSFLTTIYGKIKILDIFYCARTGQYKNNKSNQDTFLDFIRIGVYNEKYIQFRKRLVYHLVKVTNMNKKEARKLIDRAVLFYRKNSEPNTILYSKNSIRFMQTYLKSYLKIHIKYLIFLIFDTIFSKKCYYLKMNVSSKFYTDFNTIKKFVLNMI